MTRRVAVKIAYRGAPFSGSQIQPGLYTTVGQVTSDILNTGNGKPGEWFNLKVASRTDIGVNALGNVIVFNTDFEKDEDLLKALNGISPNIYYRSVAKVDESFNPRYADFRTYRYIIPKRNMDVDAIRECASIFLGKHDFARFCKDDGKATELEMKRVEVFEKEDAIVVEFEADHFLWNMIRRICAALIKVGRGRSTVADVQSALDGKAINFGVARADALTLVDIFYADVRFTEYRTYTLDWKLNRDRFDLRLEKDFIDAI